MTPQWLFFGSPASAPSDDWDANEAGIVWPWRQVGSSDSRYNPLNNNFNALPTVLKALSGAYSAGTKIGPVKNTTYGGGSSSEYPAGFNYNIQSMPVDTDSESVGDFTWPPYVAYYYPYHDKGSGTGNAKGWYVFKREEELGGVTSSRVTYEFYENQGQHSTVEFPNGGFGGGGSYKSPFIVHLSDYDGNVKNWTDFDYYTVAKGQEFSLTTTNVSSGAYNVTYTNTSHGTDSGTTYIINVLDTPYTGGLWDVSPNPDQVRPRLRWGSEVDNHTGGAVSTNAGSFTGGTTAENNAMAFTYLRKWPMFTTRWEEDFLDTELENLKMLGIGSAQAGYVNCSEAINVGSTPVVNGDIIKVKIWGPTA